MRSLTESKSNSTSTDASPTPASDAFDSAAAEHRLREAEDRLREAIEELQRRQRRATMLYPPCDHADESCVANAIGNLCQSFLLSYGVRVGIGILLRAFKLARRKSYSSLLDLKVWIYCFENVIVRRMIEFDWFYLWAIKLKLMIMRIEVYKIRIKCFLFCLFEWSVVLNQNVSKTSWEL